MPGLNSNDFTPHFNLDRLVVLGSVYTQKAPLKLEVSFAKYGDIYFKDSADANVKLVVSYSADFTSPSDDPYTSPVQLPPGMSWSSYSAQGACGFGSDGRLIAIRIKRTNIWRSSKDFKDYGKVQDLGQLIVFGQGVKASESDSTVKTFNVIANGKKEKWVANC